MTIERRPTWNEPLFSNNTKIELTVAIDSDDTEIPITAAQAALFQLPSNVSIWSPINTEYVPLVLWDGEQEPEIVYSSGHTDTVMTVSRGEESTVAKSWGVGTQLISTITAGSMEHIQEALDAIRDVLFVESSPGWTFKLWYIMNALGATPGDYDTLSEPTGSGGVVLEDSPTLDDPTCTGMTTVDGLTVEGNAVLEGSAVVDGNLQVKGNSILEGTSKVEGALTAEDVVYITKDKAVQCEASTGVNIDVLKYDASHFLTFGRWQGAYHAGTYIKGGNGSIYLDVSQTNSGRIYFRKSTADTPTNIGNIDVNGNLILSGSVTATDLTCGTYSFNTKRQRACFTWDGVLPTGSGGVAYFPQRIWISQNITIRQITWYAGSSLTNCQIKVFRNGTLIHTTTLASSNARAEPVNIAFTGAAGLICYINQNDVANSDLTVTVEYTVD
jgi:hypothetical protein